MKDAVSVLYKGKYNGCYLYELTDTDLLWDDTGYKRYQVGNIILFNSKRSVALGAELGKADDLATALAYLDVDPEHASLAQSAGQEPFAELQRQLIETRSIIDNRDGLLRELVADLDSQRNSNKVLIAQLESLREQISIERVSRNEVMDDLEVVSAETLRKDMQLQDAIDAKARLEQELAARICDLLELDSANSDLQKRLEQGAGVDSAASTFHGQPVEVSRTEISDITSANIDSSSVQLQLQSSYGHVYTMPSGKQVHLYHEFPQSKGSLLKRLPLLLRGLVRVLGLVIIGLGLFFIGSILATAMLNDLSLGESLDYTLRAVLPH